MGQMVLGGVEGAVEQGFQQFLVRLEYAQKLARIVINARNTIRIQRNFREVDKGGRLRIQHAMGGSTAR